MCENICITKKVIEVIKFIIKFVICGYCFYLAWKFLWLKCNEQFISLLVTGFAFIFLLYAKELAPFFENISIFGLNIKLREVKNLVQDLTNLLKVFAGLNMELILQPITKEQPTYKLMELHCKSIIDLLTKYNVDNLDIEEILEKYWHEKIYQIYTKILIGLITCDESFQKEFYNSWCKDGMPYQTPLGLDKISTGRKIKKENDFQIILSDYRYYYDNKKFQNENRWKEHIKLSPISYFSDKKY